MRTELPEKWYVVRTPENAQELNEWADSLVPDPEDWDRGKGPAYVFSDGWSESLDQIRIKDQGKYEEITYEEFTKLVIKKNV